MKNKIICVNTEFKFWCDLCKRSSFKSIESSVDRAHLLFDLTKEEKEIARVRIPFFNGNILICRKCRGFLEPKEKLWEAVLNLAVLPNLNPKREFEFEINNLCCP